MNIVPLQRCQQVATWGDVITIRPVLAQLKEDAGKSLPEVDASFLCDDPCRACVGDKAPTAVRPASVGGRVRCDIRMSMQCPADPMPHLNLLQQWRIHPEVELEYIWAAASEA